MLWALVCIDLCLDHCDSDSLHSTGGTLCSLSGSTGLEEEEEKEEEPSWSGR